MKDKIIPTSRKDREQLDGFWLLPGEELRDVKQVIKETVQKKILTDPVDELMRLTNSPSPEAIGENGHALASMAPIEFEHEEELRLFEALFGRDSLQVAIDVYDRYPKLLRTTVTHLLVHQGTKDQVRSDEEKGRILHELRFPGDRIAQELNKERGWIFPYYGAVDATPMLVIAAMKIVKDDPAFLMESYENKDGEMKTVLEGVNSAVTWLMTKMDESDLGVLEFKSKFAKGALNQTWRDAWDSYHHKNGDMANHDMGIADVAIQGLLYDALTDVATFQENIPETDAPIGFLAEPSELRKRAAQLRQTVLEKFWHEDGEKGYFVLGLDRDAESDNYRQMNIKTTQMGELLNSGILAGDDPEVVRKREETIKTLFSPEMRGTMGFRTLAKDEVRFRPGAYHIGTIWTRTDGIIADGLVRHGYFGLAALVSTDITTALKELGVYAEYRKGDDSPIPSINKRTVDVYDSVNSRINRVEQPPQLIQAWTVSRYIKELDRQKSIFAGKTPSHANDPMKSVFEQSVLANLIK